MPSRPVSSGRALRWAAGTHPWSGAQDTDQWTTVRQVAGSGSRSGSLR